MRIRPGYFRFAAAAMLLAATMIVPAAYGADKGQSFTGEVSDAMCGAKHSMGGPAECTRACVKHGSKYALVVGEKVYTLVTDDKAALESLDKLAGEKAKVTGTAKGDSIEVSSVGPAA